MTGGGITEPFPPEKGRHPVMRYRKELGLAAACFLMALACRLAAAPNESAETAARIAPKLLRFHVLANSNSAADQAVKLKVKDVLLKELEQALTGEDAAKYFRVEVGEPKQYAAMLTDAAKAFRRVPKEIAASAMPDDDDKINDSAATAEKIKRFVVEAVTKEVMI